MRGNLPCPDAPRVARQRRGVYYNGGMSLPLAYQVALPVPLPQVFDYLPPEGQVATVADIGKRLRVPFGRREAVGIVAGVGSAAPGQTLRHGLALLDDAPLLQGELWQSLQWLAGYLHAPLGEVLATALPALLRQGQALPDVRRHGWQLTAAGQAALPQMRAGKPQQLAAWLAAQPGQQADEALLDALQPGWRPAMRRLAERAQAQRQVPDAAPLPPLPRPAHPLNPAQQVAADAITAAHGFAPFLLEGVTGSGKTEVYLHAISQCLAEGRQALVLVPEIGLTPQMLQRFQRHLGVPVLALHSGLGNAERAAVWAAAAQGAGVIVGTRSAVFVPLPRAGLIVVDEEHDSSYKQFDGIRYHARDFALVRAKALAVPIVLGSATPSLESLHNSQRGRYVQLALRQRAGNARPPRVSVLDVRKRPLQAGLSAAAIGQIEAALAAGGQVLVFKNRRGYAPVLLCHDCGWSAHCPHCGSAERPAPMSVHASGRRLQCHHCGHRQPSPPACPDCASLALQPQGTGTERLEEFLAERFASVPVIRIDRSSTRGRDGLHRQLSRLAAQPGILVGTQMLAKGHDLPGLTLVVVVGVDEGLYSVDFRAAEKLAQLLVQVAGRAGRADKPGEVLLQTHHPGHPLLQTLVSGGYPAFARAALAERESAALPPFAPVAMLRAEARTLEAPMQFLHQARAQWLRQAEDATLECHGPLPAPHPRRAGVWRAQLLLAAAGRKPLHQALRRLVPGLYATGRGLRWSLDIDPVDFF